MNCLNYECDDDLGLHALNECGEELLAGISGMVLLECNHQLVTPDTQQILDEIAANRATLIDNIKVGIDEPSAVQIDSNIVGSTQRLVTYNRSGTLIDSNVSSANSLLYDKIFGGRTFGGAILYLKGTEDSDAGAKVLFIKNPIAFIGGMPVENNNDKIIVFNGKFAWRSKVAPQIYAAPGEIFV